MNKIVVGDGTYVIDADYVEGARACRRGGRPAPDPMPESWRAGWRNEAKHEHVRFGTDLIAAPDEGKTFEVDRSVPRVQWGSLVDRDWYALERMRLSTMREDYRSWSETAKAFSPAKVRDALRELGHDVDADFAVLVQERVHMEDVMEAHELDDDQVEIVEGLSEPRRKLLLTMAEMNDLHFTRSLVAPDVSWRCRKSAGWAAATARAMQRAGEGFLVEFRRNGTCWLTEAGWAAARHLKSAGMSKSAEDVKEPPCPTTEFDGIVEDILGPAR